MGRRSAAAKAGGNAWIAGFVGQTRIVDFLNLSGDGVQRFIPGYGNETRVLISALFWVGPLHGLFDPVGIIGLLDQAERPDADPAASRMFITDGVVGLNTRRHAIFYFDLEKIGSGNTLIAECGDRFLD